MPTSSPGRNILLGTKNEAISSNAFLPTNYFLNILEGYESSQDE